MLVFNNITGKSSSASLSAMPYYRMLVEEGLVSWYGENEATHDSTQIVERQVAV